MRWCFLSVLISVIHLVANASMCSNEGRPISTGIQLVITAQRSTFHFRSNVFSIFGVGEIYIFADQQLGFTTPGRCTTTIRSFGRGLSLPEPLAKARGKRLLVLTFAICFSDMCFTFLHFSMHVVHSGIDDVDVFRRCNCLLHVF